jgi:hypothetical protein
MGSGALWKRLFAGVVDVECASGNDGPIVVVVTGVGAECPVVVVTGVGAECPVVVVTGVGAECPVQMHH